MFVVGAYPHGDYMVEAINTITGWDVTPEEVQKTGERILNMRQAFNIREGLNAREFYVPDRIMGRPPKTKGPNAGMTLVEDEVYNEFLTAMDWDLKTTKPSREKLLELGLNDVADDLYPE